MKLKIHHPRILVVLLLVIEAVASAAILLADQGEKVPTNSLPIPAAPISTTLSKQDQEDAISIVKTSGVVESINGGQGWEPELVSRTKITGREGIVLEAKWSNPVESSGPWSLMHCSGTLKMFTRERWSQVTRLVIWVDMEDRAVAGLGVTSEPEDYPQPFHETISPDEPIKMYDAETGEVLYDGPTSGGPMESEVCEEGTYYRD